MSEKFLNIAQLHGLAEGENIRSFLSETELKTVVKYEEIARAMIDAGASYECVKDSLHALINPVRKIA